jgi:hypothetical protein
MTLSESRSKLEEIARALREKKASLSNPEAEMLARAAVDALRVPSEEIHAIILDYNDMFTSPDEVWESLIDAILKEKP